MTHIMDYICSVILNHIINSIINAINEINRKCQLNEMFLFYKSTVASG